MSQTRTCPKCTNEHPIEFFNWKDKKKGRRSTICKNCTRKYGTTYYQDNAEEMKGNSMRSNMRRRQENALKMYEYLKVHPCPCGESDPLVLDPDHLRDKKSNISKMLNNGYTWNGIMKELAKCEIKCANCHRRKTGKEQGWRKALWQAQEMQMAQ